MWYCVWQVPARGRPDSTETCGQAEAVQGPGIDIHIGRFDNDNGISWYFILFYWYWYVYFDIGIGCDCPCAVRWMGKQIVEDTSEHPALAGHRGRISIFIVIVMVSRSTTLDQDCWWYNLDIAPLVVKTSHLCSAISPSSSSSSPPITITITITVHQS